MKAALIWALLAGPAMAQQTCQPIADSMLRLACYEASPIPQQCTAHAADPVMQVACIDHALGRPLKPSGPDEARQCQVLLPDKDAALQCYQAATPAPASPIAASEKVKYWAVQVREQGLPKLAQLKEPAQIGYKRENHRSDPIIKAALTTDGPPLGFIDDWNWFGSLDLNIDLSAPAKQRANSKSLGIGARGILFDYNEKNFAIDSTVRLIAKNDSEAHTRSQGLGIGNLAIIKGWADGGPGQQTPLAFQVIPAFGFTYEDLRRVETGKPKGAYTSAYAGVNVSAWPHAWKRAQLNLRLQRFINLNVTGGLAKRYANYASFGIDYFLYDPTKDAPPFAPPHWIDQRGRGRSIDGDG